MSVQYTTIIQVKDYDNDVVSLKLVFKKTEAEAFDSKGRYFYANDLNLNCDYLKLKVLYHDFEGNLSIFLNGGGYDDNYALNEIKDSPLHLNSIDAEIMEAEQKLQMLLLKKNQIAKFYTFC